MKGVCESELSIVPAKEHRKPSPIKLAVKYMKM